MHVQPVAGQTWGTTDEGATMAVCDSCGNDYDKTFTITRGDETRTFDSFECAINVMAPTCATCSTRIVGHGVESGGQIYCCAHCSGRAGVERLQDRA
jgi:ribosome-binding protein aMBF1 (putative translation factor)